MTTLEGKKIVLAVTGGIAAYKAAELTRRLITGGAEVRVAMTEGATRFITPLTFEALTGQPVVTNLWAPAHSGEIGHISLADWADAVLIAPATANIVGKLAGGIADDLVSTFLLAVGAPKPVLICPAMNVNMFEHPSVQKNLAVLAGYGYHIVEPASGHLACGWEGKGRLPDPEVIAEELMRAISPKDLDGRTIMVTSGPTREPWDSIRFLSNRSSGRMGAALARMAFRRGAKVVLVTGPVDLAPPYGVESIPVQSTEDMKQAVMDNLARVQVLIKAAAPADFRPARVIRGKIKKDQPPPPIELVRNPDILAEVGQNKKGLILVGFAAESEDLIPRAKAKLKAKNLDLIVANQIDAPGTAFGTATNQVSIIDRDGQVEQLPLMDKDEVADHILDRVAGLLPTPRT